MISKPTLSGNRLQWVDYSKGIGIILVVYGHVLRGLNSAGMVNASFFDISDTFVYSFHMPLFFIVSGLFFESSFRKDSNGFMLKKAKTLLHPFIIWSLIQTMVQVVLSNYTNDKVPFSALFTCLIIPRAQFWFLYTLFFINVINYLIYRFAPKFALLISCLVWLVSYVIHADIDPFTTVFQYLAFFNFGIAIGQNKDQLAKLARGKWAFPLVVLFGVAEYFYFINQHTTAYVTDLLLVFTGIVGTLLIAQISYRAQKIRMFNFLEAYGKASIGIYLMHILVASGSRIVLSKFLKISDPTIHIVAGTVLGLVIPYYVYQFCMKSAYLSWFFQVNDKRDERQKAQALA
ncbi:acyltransferase [Mucilaginibacter sp. JRF]|uniref:acyltransferase family protein n=1 Tax=Mucilaginibacter sp. JRF TaxID=2780088 RepID=UPI001882E5E5|nr:acyltransferase [Mucilaginibacter sp. JRF]MBE9583771.1 acyltransferase [Mucilaginibacter sp. JRF]